MIRAGPWERISDAIVRDPHVSELGMEQAVDEPTVHDHTAADAGTDGDVTEAVETDGSSPALLAEGGGVDVCVEGDRNVERLFELPGDVRLCPPRLRRSRDEAEAA